MKNALQDLDRRPQSLGAGEGPIQLDAVPPRTAREFHARKVLAHANLQIRKALVVFQIHIETRLDVLDQARFQQECIHLGFRFHIIHVGDQLDQVGRARILPCSLGEVMPRPVAQVFGLADVQHPSLPVLHQVDAGAGGKLLDLVARLRSFNIRLFLRHETPARVIPDMTSPERSDR